jgi:hypothetical protein
MNNNNIPMPMPMMFNNVEQLRQQRNNLLRQTDIYVLQDFPITPEQLIEVKAYRQFLRDYMAQFKDIPTTQPTFPTIPSFIKF